MPLFGIPVLFGPICQQQPDKSGSDSHPRETPARAVSRSARSRSHAFFFSPCFFLSRDLNREKTPRNVNIKEMQPFPKSFRILPC